MKIMSDILSVVGFILLVDWNIFLEWYYYKFLEGKKHFTKYNRVDSFVLHNKGHKVYNPSRDSFIKSIAFVILLLSGIITVFLDLF